MAHLANAELPVAAASQLALVVADLVHVDPQRAEHLAPGVVLGAPVYQMSEAVSQGHNEVSTSPYIQVGQMSHICPQCPVRHSQANQSILHYKYQNLKLAMRNKHNST